VGRRGKKIKFEWFRDETLFEKYSRPNIGDVLFSLHGMPNGGILYWKDFDNKRKGHKISIDNLKDYLKLLELLVLFERVIVGTFPSFEMELPESGTDIENVENILHDYIQLYRVAPVLSLEEDLRKRVKGTGIIVDAVLENKQIPPPNELVERYMNIDKYLVDEFNEDRELIKQGYGVEDGLAARMAAAVLAIHYGGPTYISEFCRLAGITYWLHEREAKMLANQQILEYSTRTQVIGALKESLDIGARKELENIEKFGINTVFPESPIASSIIKESNRPEDLNIVALQMRDKFSNLRHYFNEIQKEMINEDASLEKKMKLYKEIETMRNELWKKEGEGWDTILIQTTNLIHIVAEASTTSIVNSLPAISAYLLGQPYALIRGAIRKRKLRVLLDSKKDFLRSRNYIQKIAGIFGITAEDVRQALLG
jgi:hypothetical protein